MFRQKINGTTLSIVRALLGSCTLEQSLSCYAGQVWLYLKHLYLQTLSIIYSKTLSQKFSANIIYKHFLQKILQTFFLQIKPTLTSKNIVLSTNITTLPTIPNSKYGSYFSHNHHHLTLFNTNVENVIKTCWKWPPYIDIQLKLNFWTSLPLPPCLRRLVRMG